MNVPKKKLKLPSSREDAEIDRAIAADPDTWIASEEEWRRMRPAREVDPDLGKTGVPQQSAKPSAKAKQR